MRCFWRAKDKDNAGEGVWFVRILSNYLVGVTAFNTHSALAVGDNDNSGKAAEGGFLTNTCQSRREMPNQNTNARRPPTWTLDIGHWILDIGYWILDIATIACNSLIFTQKLFADLIQQKKIVRKFN